MVFLAFVIFTLAVFVLLILGYLIPVFKNHNKTTGNVINYDSTMSKFVYRVNMSREEIIDTLNIKNNMDDLSCTFDFERSVILFSEYGSSKEYFFEIQECDGFSIIRLTQVPFIGMQSYVPFKLNPFLVSKINAQIIPFSQYGI